MRGGRFPWRLWLIPVLIYMPFIANPFVWEDRLFLEEHPATRDPGSWRKFFVPAEFLAMGWERGPVYRPFANLTHLADQQIWGQRPAPRRAENLALHLLAIFLVWHLAMRFVTERIAFWAAILFAVHPANGEVIFGIFHRCQILVSSLCLGAAALWLGVGESWVWGAIPLYGAALLAKETAFPLPFILMTGDLVLAGWRRLRERAPLYGGLLTMAGIYLTVRTRLLEGTAQIAAPSTVAGWIGSLVTAAVSAQKTFRLIVWPFNLSIAHPLAADPLAPVAAASSVDIAIGAGLASTALIAIAVAWRRRPVIAFGLAAAFLAALPTANLVHLPGAPLAVSERQLYFPLAWASLAAAGLAAVVTARAAAWQGRIVRVGLAALVMVFGIRVALRGLAWRDGTTIAREWKEAYPASSWARLPYAYELLKARRFQEAEAEYGAALAGSAGGVQDWMNLGICDRLIGRPDQAGTAFRRAAEMSPHDPRPFDALGRISYGRHRYAEAVTWFRKEVSLMPDNAEGHRWLGASYFHSGRWAEAAEEFNMFGHLGGSRR